MAKWFGLSLDDKDDDDEWSQSNLGSMFRSWSFFIHRIKYFAVLN
jgi:hypothetical protein